MEDKIIAKDIIIKAKDLNSNVRKNIEKKLESLENTCTQENGYIIKFIKILEIKNNKILENSGNVLLKVKFFAKVLNPYVGAVLRSKITMIFRHGIFCEYNTMPILVPYTKLVGYNFMNSTFQRDNNILKIHDYINVVITDIRYSKNKFNCIGSLKIKF